MTDELPELSRIEVNRYSRHLTLPIVGIDGQRKLKGARVLLVGAGGLGSPAALYLAAAGVGTIGLVDFDVVDETNLQRQVLHGTRNIGQPKLHSARDRILDINPHVSVETHETRLQSSNALGILRDYDVIIDGSDNFPTRYLTNDACVLLGKPNVYGSIYRFDGQASVFAVPGGPCYRCLVPEPPPPGTVPSCAEGGVLGVLPGLVGTIQATEAIKLILGIGDTLAGRLLLIDALNMEFRTVRLRRDTACPACSGILRELIDYNLFCGEAPSAQQGTISSSGLKELLDGNSSVQLIDVREPVEWQSEHLRGATLIPLRQLSSKLIELDAGARTVVYCKSGQRSDRAAQVLRQAGFANVVNLRGGLDEFKRFVGRNVDGLIE